MHNLFIFLLGACTISLAFSAPFVIIKKDALICYERSDWESMVSAMMDTNLQVMRSLVESGKCQRSVKQMKATYLDPIRGSAALVQMPSGRTAFVFEIDIQR